MTFNAGAKLRASDLDTIGTTSLQFIGAAQTTSSQIMTASSVDLGGSSLTFSTQYANTKCTIWACFDVTFVNNSDVTAGGVTFVGTCVVDGVTVSGEAHFTGFRGTVFQEWIVTLAATGNHTVSIQGKRSTSSFGDVDTNGTHTKWHALVFGP